MRHVIPFSYGLTGRGQSVVSISCCVSGRAGKRGEAPAFLKDVVHGAVRAICYMLDTTSLRVASQEPQASANLHGFRSCISHFPIFPPLGSESYSLACPLIISLFFPPFVLQSLYVSLLFFPQSNVYSSGILNLAPPPSTPSCWSYFSQISSVFFLSLGTWTPSSHIVHTLTLPRQHMSTASVS